MKAFISLLLLISCTETQCFLNIFFQQTKRMIKLQPYINSNTQSQYALPMAITNNNNQDLSSHGIKKKIIKSSSSSSSNKNFPDINDSVEIRFKMFRSDGSLAHDSSSRGSSNNAASSSSSSSQLNSNNNNNMNDNEINDDDEGFDFKIGSTPCEVIPGWEIAVKSMMEGETSQFLIPSSLAFGEKGLPPPISIQPNEDLLCELTLLRIVPALSKRYQPIGVNESIREELVEKIQTDKSQFIPPEEKVKEAKFYDESKHKLDPNQRVGGQGINHAWEETATTIDLRIPIKQRVMVTKHDLMIDIQSKSISIQLLADDDDDDDNDDDDRMFIPLMIGPLYGKIVPSESTWAIINPTPTTTTSSGSRSSSNSMINDKNDDYDKNNVNKSYNKNDDDDDDDTSISITKTITSRTGYAYTNMIDSYIDTTVTDTASSSSSSSGVSARGVIPITADAMNSLTAENNLPFSTMNNNNNDNNSNNTTYLQICLLKAHNHQTIWATVFTREFVAQQQQQQQLLQQEKEKIRQEGKHGQQKGFNIISSDYDDDNSSNNNSSSSNNNSSSSSSSSSSNNNNNNNNNNNDYDASSHFQ